MGMVMQGGNVLVGWMQGRNGNARWEWSYKI